MANKPVPECLKQLSEGIPTPAVPEPAPITLANDGTAHPPKRSVGINLRHWHRGMPPRYFAVAVSDVAHEARLSSHAARRLASAVESLDPESAARLREVSDELIDQVSRDTLNLGDVFEEVEDRPEEVAQAYRILRMILPGE